MNEVRSTPLHRVVPGSSCNLPPARHRRLVPWTTIIPLPKNAARSVGSRSSAPSSHAGPVRKMGFRRGVALVTRRRAQVITSRTQPQRSATLCADFTALTTMTWWRRSRRRAVGARFAMIRSLNIGGPPVLTTTIRPVGSEPLSVAGAISCSAKRGITRRPSSRRRSTFRSISSQSV